jgi:hypothetical protein
MIAGTRLQIEASFEKKTFELQNVPSSGRTAKKSLPYGHVADQRLPRPIA